MQEQIYRLDLPGLTIAAPTPDGAANLFGRLHEALGSIHPINKARHSEKLPYDYVRYEDIAANVRAALLAAGLSWTVTTSHVEQIPSGATTRGGAAIMHTSLTAHIIIMDPQSGALLQIAAPGEALAGDDKGMAKALTNAVKYGIMRAVLLTDNEADEDANTEPAADAEPQAQAPCRSNGNGHAAEALANGWTAEDLRALHAFASEQSKRAGIEEIGHVELHSVLGVASLAEYTGDIAAAKRDVTLYITNRRRLTQPAASRQ